MDDRADRPFRLFGQDWLISWEPPDAVPAGTAHGSAGLCLTADERVVIVSTNGVEWDLPGGRPEAGEDWRATLEREVLEEACARVDRAVLLGFSRGECVAGEQQGTVLVRALWRASVTLAPWAPRHEMTVRRLVTLDELSAIPIGGAPPWFVEQLVREASVHH